MPVELLRIWYHENTRVFGDRMINDGDRSFLSKLMVERAEHHFQLGHDDIYNVERILFCDFLDGMDVDPRIYKQATDLPRFQEMIDEFLEDYNGAVKTPMHLVMFLDACDHVSRI